MTLLCSLEPSDWIELFGIIVNVIFGVIIVVVINKRVSNNRALKDYFINEIKDIRDAYRKFLNELIGGKFDFNKTNNWFQVMNIRLTELEKILKENYPQVTLPAKEKNQELRYLITSSQEFNDSYNKPTFTVSPALKQNIFKIHSEINSSLICTVVKINKG